MIASSHADSTAPAPVRSVSRLPIVLLLLLLGSLLLLAGCGQEAPAATATPTPAATDTPIPPTVIAETPPTATPLPANIAPYTGNEVADPALLRKRPIFVCINNDAISRSAHFGLDKADLVYEYIVDGFTMTRMTALWLW